MPPTRPYWWLPSALLLAGVCGCLEELGPVHFATTRVDGVVREAGRPVGGGFIEFVPIDGTVGNLRSAPLGSDGRFEATRVAVGRNLIRLVNAPIALPGGRRLFASGQCPIRRDIPAGPATTLVIDLLTEAIRHQNESAARLPETAP